MTRASLLHILDHVSTISDAEVGELEQLATAFPYCQTAHLLLAKAAHDKGSMLASQRLRRAATHASDRQLLRQLIEQQPTTVALLPEATAAASLEPVAAVEDTPLLAAAPIEDPLPSVALLAESSFEEDREALQELEEPATALPVTVSEEAASASATIVSAVTIPTAELVEVNSSLAQEEIVPQSVPQATEEDEETALVAMAPVETLAEVEELLPAVAPPIRPPVEAGTSRFEFGLGEAAATLAAYTLPTDVAVVTPKSPPFYADEEVGYTLGYGSRLGSCLQAHGELTNDLPDTDFFPADALLLEHLAAQQPVAATPSSLAIIERFLRKQPRLRAPAVVPPASDEQADLSVPSTSATPALASESLANIMVRQGKTAKAIEIYERLMVRQPEKKAYFAAQIDQLKLSE